MASRRGIAIVLLSTAALVATVQLWRLARSTAGMDFYQMWVGARAATEFEDFYSPEMRRMMGAEFLRRAQIEEHSVKRLVVARYRQELETLSTPLLYTIYSPLRGSYERDLLLFQLAVIVALPLWVAILSAAFGYSTIRGLLFYCAIAIAYRPVRSDLQVGNMNEVILVLLAAGLWLLTRRRLMAAGAVFAFATLIKPYTILLVPLLLVVSLVQRRWADAGRLLGGGLASASAGILLSVVYFQNAAIWTDWLRAFRAMPEAMVPVEMGNFAFSLLVAAFDAGGTLPILLMGTTVIVVAFMARRVSSLEAEVVAATMSCLIFYISSPIVWLHHLLLALPLIAYLLRPQEEAAGLQRHVRSIQASAAAGFFILAVGPWDWMLSTATQVAVVVNCGIGMLLVAGLLELRNSMRPQPAQLLV